MSSATPRSRPTDGPTAPTLGGATTTPPPAVVDHVAHDPPQQELQESESENANIFDLQYSSRLERDNLNKRKIEWASKQTMLSVEFNDELTEVVKIGTRPISDFMLPMLRAFCRRNGIQVPNSASKKQDMIRLIIQHHKNEGLRAAIGSIGRDGQRRSAKSTRPLAAKQDGTLFRVIAVLTHPTMKETFLQTVSSYTRSELDSGLGHKEQWQKLTDFYMDKDCEELATLGTQSRYIAYGYNDDVPSHFDPLNINDFKMVVEFIGFHYNKMRKDKNQSGQHKTFEEFVSKGWLLFYHHRLVEIGDKDLSQAVYAELPEGAFIVSSGSRRQVPPEPSPLTVCNSQDSAMGGSTSKLSSTTKSRDNMFEAFTLEANRRVLFIEEQEKQLAKGDIIRISCEKVKYDRELIETVSDYNAVKEEVKKRKRENLSVSNQLKEKLRMLKNHKRNLSKIQKTMNKNLSELKEKVKWDSDNDEDSDSSFPSSSDEESD